MTDTCYMCDRPETSKEHVPPKCLFPEAKDVDGNSDYRVNLITVPSCDTHNTAKSKDDVYLLFFLAANVVSNELSDDHFSTKIMRAIKRSPHVFSEFAKKNIPVVIEGEDGEKIQTAAIELDRERFDREIKHIAHGIYRHKNNSNFEGEITVFSEGLIDLNSDDSVDLNNSIQSLGKAIDVYFSNTPVEGDNVEIFTFQILKDVENKQTMIRLFFYGEFKVTAIMKHV